MTEDAGRASFLRAINAAPADPLPQSMYADWLDENGHADEAELWRWQAAPPVYPMMMFAGGGTGAAGHAGVIAGGAADAPLVYRPRDARRRGI